jgi:two-component system, NtrC family, response regulator HydG
MGNGEVKLTVGLVKIPILAIVEDDILMAEFLASQSRRFGFEPQVIHSGVEAISLFDGVRNCPWDVMLLDLGLPDSDGRELLKIFKQRFPEAPCVVLTSSGKAEDAVLAIRRGADDFVVKPQLPETLFPRVWGALNRSLDFSFPLAGEGEVGMAVPLIWTCDAMIPVRDVFRRASGTMQTVLIEGEFGVEKAEFAKRLHNGRGAEDCKFVELNSRSVQEDDWESRLFGGSGASGASNGLLNSSYPSTLLLNELKDLPTSIQIRLAELLSSGRGTGGCRIISISSIPLNRLVFEPGIHAELVYHLSRLVISIPPLRQRRKDLVRCWKKLLRSRLPDIEDGLELAKDTENAIDSYWWPGNLEQFYFAADEVARNLTDRVVRLSDFKKASKEWLMWYGLPHGVTQARFPPLERSCLLEALSTHDWNRRRAAEWLGISLRSIYNLMDRHGLR